MPLDSARVMCAHRHEAAIQSFQRLAHKILAAAGWS